MDKKIYTSWWFWGAVIVLIIATFYAVGQIGWWGEGAKYRIQKTFEEQYVEDIERKSNELKEAYKNDPYGGDTPEETWGMFVAALEAGDVDLASKYFVVEKQEEMMKAFSAGKENEAIEDFLQDVARIESGKYYKDDNKKYRFVVIGTEGKWNGVVEFTYDLILNKETNKWKIRDL